VCEVEVREKSGEGAAAVVEGEAVGGGKLGHGAVEGGNEEERVVAEAAGAAWSGEDLALDGAFGGVEDAAVAGKGQDAAVTGLAALRGDAGEGSEESGVVAEVYCVCGVVGVSEIGGEAGAAHTGRSIECGDFEAGVVGEDIEVGCAEGVVDGFETGVEFEGGLVLGRGGDGGEIGKRFDADGRRGRGGAGEVAELAWIGGGGVEEHEVRVKQA
jgi:hypothetical protein